jgi:phage-related minor tail protein
MPQAETDTTSETQPTIEADSETAGDSETPDDDTTEQESSEGEQPEDKPGKRKGGFQRRMDKLTRQSAEQRAQIEALEKRLAEAKQPAATTQEPEQPPVPAKRPIVDEYNTYEEYVEALTDYKVTQREQAQREQAERKAAEAELETKRTTYANRLEAAKQRYADFDEAMADAADLKITRVMQEAMYESEVGPDLAYFWANNPNEVERIAKLSPLQAAREIGKLELRLAPKESAKAPVSAREPQPKRQTSKAPEPITPIAGGQTVSEKNPDDMTFEEYKVWRMSQKTKRNR